MKKFLLLPFGLAIFLACSLPLRAGGPEAVAGPAAPAGSPDKSGYHLFHPVPREFLRDMSTDRPDKTESAYTVDAGHFQLEMDFFNYTHERYDADTGADTRTDTWNVAPFNLKAGLLNNVDLQVIFDSYLQEQTEDRTAGTTERTSGIGDTTVRVKVNLWGNDGDRTALAVMPFVKAPTNSAGLGNNSVEGGLIVPLAVELGGGWNMGVMTEVDVVRDESGSGHRPEFINSITFSRNIAGKLGGYVEFFSSVNGERGFGWEGTADVGLTYALTADMQLDGGCNFGVTRAADDVNPFLGLSVRF